MKNVLITGATGNVGIEVIRNLYKSGVDYNIYAGVRNIEKAKLIFSNYAQLNYSLFDIENPDSFNDALIGMDSIFLLRPPHISDVERYFKPLIDSIYKFGIKEIVFLSVQGAEKSKIIPHNKIERLIVHSGLNYIFLRPSYFMQNLTTTLLNDIQNKRKIILPAGNAKFNWIDLRNIGEVSSILLNRFDEFKNKAYEITGYENEDFYKVEEFINNAISSKIEYMNLNPLRFYLQKRKDGMQTGMIIVMILLHFLPRFQKEPEISKFYEELTGKKPIDLNQFIRDNADNFANISRELNN